ncbi:MAG: hypothetical protein RPU52_15350, partial [Candidatus Sedimenticola sp. (ex Thyasira tokunagai)]
GSATSTFDTLERTYEAYHALRSFWPERGEGSADRLTIWANRYLSDFRCQPWRAKRRLVIPGSREAALLTRRARSAPEGKPSRHPNTASSHWELTAKR